MSNFFKNYWKNTYQKHSEDNYEIQSAQAKETFNWHKKYVQSTLPTFFNNYSPRILDIGCSSGYLTNLLSNFSSDVVGIDYEEGFILKAKSKYTVPKFIVSNIHNLNEIDGLFDLIVCFGVIQYIENLESAFKNLKSKLKKNTRSRIIITTINDNSIFNRNSFWRKLTYLKGSHELNYKTFSKEEFIKLSKNSGLKITKFEYLYILPKIISPLHFFVKFIFPKSFSHHVFIEMQNA